MNTPNPSVYARDRRATLQMISARADQKSAELAGKSRDDLALLLRAKAARLGIGDSIRVNLWDVLAIALVALERHDELQAQQIALRLPRQPAPAAP